MTTPRRLQRDAFEALLYGLTAESFAGFLADLYALQGWSVSREGAILELSRETPIATHRTVLAAVEPPVSIDDVDPTVDVVASPGRSRATEAVAADLGARLQGPDDLYDLAMFGVDRESSTALLYEHFDRGVVDDGRAASPTTREPAVGTTRERMPSPDPPGGAPNGERMARWRWSKLDRSSVLAVTALVAILVLAGAGGALDPVWPLEPGGSTDASSPATAPTTLETVTTTGSTTTAPDGIEGSDARGLDDGNGSAAGIQPRYLGLTPTCERPPGLVAVIIVEALRNNDPETDDGIRTAWNFSSPMSRRAAYEDFHRFVTNEKFDPLYDFESATYTPAYRDPGVSAHRVTVTDRTGASHSYVFVLSDQTGSLRDGCWLLAGIVTE